MPGVRKSGIPELVEIPAPTQRTMFFGLWVLMYLQKSQWDQNLVWFYSATPSKSDAVITFDMSNFVDRENGTPINEDFFCCLLPFFGMQSSRVDRWLR